MKIKIFYLGTCILLIVSCIFLNSLYSTTQIKRVHQHQTDTSLPVVRINTNGQEIPGAPKEQVNSEGISYLSTSSVDSTEEIIANISFEDGESTIVSDTRLHYRGNSSRYFDKKSYSVKLVNSDGTKNAQKLFGMSKHNDWVLNGPFLDRSLMRNYLCYNIAGEIMSYSPNVRYCELYVNEEYQGLYLLVETVSQGIGRINLTKTEKNKPYTSFIVNWDRTEKTKLSLENFTAYTMKSSFSSLSVRYPGTLNLTEDKFNYISTQISDLEKILYSSSLFYEDTYSSILDMNEFAEYFVINEFFRNADAGFYSTYLYKDLREKIKPVVWDFNNCCDNFIHDEFDESGFSLTDAPWFNQLLKDKEFVTLVIETYRVLREQYLSEEYLMNYIDDVDTWLGDSITKNDMVWGYVYDTEKIDEYNYLLPKERNVTSHEEAVEQLKDYITRRGNWLDNNIEILYQYCSDSKNTNHFVR